MEPSWQHFVLNRNRLREEEKNKNKLKAVLILSFPDDSNEARRGSCTVNSCSIRERRPAKSQLFVLLHQLETPTDTQLNNAMITAVLLPTTDWTGHPKGCECDWVSDRTFAKNKSAGQKTFLEYSQSVFKGKGRTGGGREFQVEWSLYFLFNFSPKNKKVGHKCCLDLRPALFFFSLHCSVVSLNAHGVSLVLSPQQSPTLRRGRAIRRGPGGSAAVRAASSQTSAARNDSKAFGDAGHVVQHNAQEEKQHARHEYHCAHAGPRGPFPSSSHRVTDSPVALASVQPHPHALQTHPQTQGLLLRHCHHCHPLLLAAGQKTTSQLPRQTQRPLLGDGQRQHVAAVTGEADEDGCVLRGVRDGDDSDDIRVIGELGDGQARRELSDAAAPGTTDLLLAAAHLGQTHRAARVSAVQELGPPPRAVVVKADLALQNWILGKSLHYSKAGGGSSTLPETTGQSGFPIGATIGLILR